ncbi:hypothetical protein HAX54_045557 [Datura stramonium]|uniref:Uncharacterized protein n=1 Tax=Datura stramonium TaxID=4076 RepID=A0ABS8WJT8_DATST|nr:hypothetical protein [Datura stramonium]
MVPFYGQGHHQPVSPPCLPNFLIWSPHLLSPDLTAPQPLSPVPVKSQTTISPSHSGILDFASFPTPNPTWQGIRASRHAVVTSACLGLPIPLEADLPKGYHSTEGTFNDDIFKHLAPFQYQYMGKRSGDIHNTSPLIEGGSAFIDSMAQLVNAQNIKQWAIGPILPTKLDHHSTKENECLDWLNKQPPRSVLFVSFGTSTEFSDEQINELMMGLG